MNRQRFLWLVVAAVVVLAAALFWSARRNASSTSEVGVALLPNLVKNANGITEISVRHGSATPNVTIRNQGGTWTVEQRADYPADVSKVRKLVVSLTDAKIIEQKTSDPTKFPVIGVDDPSGAAAAGTEIGWTAPDGKHTVIIGKPAGEGNFARRGGENVSYTVEPSISVETEPKYWIEPKLVDIPTASIQGIEVKPASGPGYSVHRAPAPAASTSSSGGSAAASAAKAGTASATATAPGHAKAAAGGTSEPGDFALEGVPAGRKAAEAATLAPSPSVLASLTADDVSPASNVDFTKPTVATVTLADGTVLTVTGASSGDKHWIELKSSKDTALNTKLAGRAFEIPGYRYDSIFRPIDQLLVPKEPAPSAKGAKSPSAAPGSPASSPITSTKKKPKDSPAQP